MLLLASSSMAPHSGVPAIKPTPKNAKLETDKQIALLEKVLKELEK